VLLESVEATRRYESGLFLRHLRVLGLGFESPSFIMGFSEVRLPTINRLQQGNLFSSLS